MNVKDENGDDWYGSDDTLGYWLFMGILLLAVVIINAVAIYRLGSWPWS